MELKRFRFVWYLVPRHLIRRGTHINVRFDLSNSTLTTEQQAMVDGINKFLAWLPDYEDSTVARRLAMGLLESADVAPQRELAAAAGFSQDRSVRVYQERLKEQGLAGLFNRATSARPGSIW